MQERSGTGWKTICAGPKRCTDSRIGKEGEHSGDDAGSYIDRSIEIARQRRSQVEESFDRLGSVDSVVQEIVREFYDKNPEYMLPEEIAYGVNRQIVRHIVSSMDSAEKL